MEILGGALIMGLAAMLLMGIIGLFSKSESKKNAERKEKVIRNPDNTLKEIIDIAAQTYIKDPDEALKYLTLSNLSLNDNIDGPQELLKFYYFAFIGIILFNKKRFNDSEAYLKKTIDYIETGVVTRDKDFNAFCSYLIFLFGGLLYIRGLHNEAEKYRIKAIKLNKSRVIYDFSKFNDFI